MSQQKYNKLAGKHVLILGGTSGIGFCVAEASLESSASVTVSSSSPDKVKATVSKLQASYPNGKVQGFVCDLSKPTLEKDIESLFTKVGKVDHIVFTAGDPLAVKALKDHTLETIQAAGQIRFFAPLLLAKVGIKYLKESAESSIILTTGSIAQKPAPDWSVIAAYAAGLYGMTRNLAFDLKPIRVNLVAPGPIVTELWNGFPEEQRKAILDRFSKATLTGSVGKPEDIAETYLGLMKDVNVTGSVVESNGGHLLV